jgi:hypothetical protein
VCRGSVCECRVSTSIYNFCFEVFGVPVCQTRNSCIDGNPYNLPDVIYNLTSVVTLLGTHKSTSLWKCSVVWCGWCLDVLRICQWTSTHELNRSEMSCTLFQNTARRRRTEFMAVTEMQVTFNGRKWLLLVLMYYFRICLEGIRSTTENLF